MIETITVHLEKKKEQCKDKGFEKSKINIVDQGNTKFGSIYVIDKNIIFASDCTNKRIVTLTINPANIRLDEDVLKTSFVFVFRRRLDQDEYVHLSLTSSEDVFKTSWSRPIYPS